MNTDRNVVSSWNVNRKSISATLSIINNYGGVYFELNTKTFENSPSTPTANNFITRYQSFGVCKAIDRSVCRVGQGYLPSLWLNKRNINSSVHCFVPITLFCSFFLWISTPSMAHCLGIQVREIDVNVCTSINDYGVVEYGDTYHV